MVSADIHCFLSLTRMNTLYLDNLSKEYERLREAKEEKDEKDCVLFSYVDVLAKVSLHL
jgi:hypothetical protein